MKGDQLIGHQRRRSWRRRRMAASGAAGNSPRLAAAKHRARARAFINLHESE